jgi:AcrR family transcriptional regulator
MFVSCSINNIGAKMLPKEKEKEDLRVLRTRQLLYDAFIDMLGKKRFRSITVGEITDQAMVNRATFYAHFADKYALFEYAIRKSFQQTLDAQIPEDCYYSIYNIQIVISAVCDFLKHLNGHCHPVEAQELPSFDEIVIQMVGEIIADWFPKNDDCEYVEPPNLVVDMVSWAIYGAALHWSKHNQDEPSVEFAVKITPMINGILDGIPIT